jgi:hypothetical protein
MRSERLRTHGHTHDSKKPRIAAGFLISGHFSGSWLDSISREAMRRKPYLLSFEAFRDLGR